MPPAPEPDPVPTVLGHSSEEVHEKEAPTDDERKALDLLRRMLARPEYLVPLAAAEHQYRAHYYRLNAGALLEDLFFDALTNYVRQHEPQVSLARAATGEKGWDYSLGGLHISHKVRRSQESIAAIWDATLDLETYTSDHPIVVVVSNYSSVQVKVSDGSTNGILRPLSAGAQFPKGRRLVLTRWPADEDSLQILEATTIEEAVDRIWQVLPFDQVWRWVVENSDSTQFNELELFLTNSSTFNPSGAGWKNTNDILRPGAYLIPQSRLINVAVTSNNRAVLYPSDFINQQLRRSLSDGLIAPMSRWYQPYSEDRPPDLYGTQRAEYDALFNKQGFRR